MFARPYLYITVIVLALGILYRQGALVGIRRAGRADPAHRLGLAARRLGRRDLQRRFAEDHVFWGETVASTWRSPISSSLPLSWLETEELFADAIIVEGAPE